MNNSYSNMPLLNNQMTGVFQRFQQFQKIFTGNPRQQIQQMLNSGQISQQQYDQAVQMATQFQKMLGGH